jgi:hypothetical protein
MEALELLRRCQWHCTGELKSEIGKENHHRQD